MLKVGNAKQPDPRVRDVGSLRTRIQSFATDKFGVAASHAVKVLVAEHAEGLVYVRKAAP